MAAPALKRQPKFILPLRGDSGVGVKRPSGISIIHVLPAELKKSALTDDNSAFENDRPPDAPPLFGSSTGVILQKASRCPFLRSYQGDRLVVYFGLMRLPCRKSCMYNQQYDP